MINIRLAIDFLPKKSVGLSIILYISSGISTLVAQKYGSGEKDKAKRILSVGSIMMAAVSLVLTAVVIIFGGSLVELFGASEEAVRIGTSFFVRIACFYIAYGLANAARGCLEGTGELVYSSAAGMISLGARIALSYALVPLFDNMVIAYAEAISWIILLILYLVRLRIMSKN